VVAGLEMIDTFFNNMRKDTPQKIQIQKNSMA